MTNATQPSKIHNQSRHKARTMTVVSTKTPKKQGYVLVATFIISSLILTVGLGLAQILATELEFSADLLFAEKSYYAAESGVEKALLELKDQPLQHMEEEEFNLTDDGEETFTLDMGNQVDTFQTTIAPQASLQFRLQKDTDKSKDVEIQSISNFEITPQSQNPSFQWRVQCRTRDAEEAETVVALVGDWSTGVNSRKLKNLQGKKDNNSNATPQLINSFLNELTQENKKTCFLTFENKTQNGLEIKIKAAEEESFSPPIARVKSTGKAGSREKIITFQYAQKRLPSAFGFGILSTE